MKINKIFSMIVVVVAMVMAFNSYGQAKYYPGYVIVLNGDTLKGEIKKNPKREFDNFTKAAYRKKDGSEIKTFNPTKIKEYCVDGVTFVSRNVDGEQVFVKRVSKGVANLYESQIEVMQMNDIKVKSDYYMEKQDGGFVRIKSGKFKKQIEEVMADNEEIVKALEEKKYDYDNIVELFNAYNKTASN
ncbi:MAG: hypothetical protein NTX97_04080 [Bacteroidetes bacterium]|nr:hypothetical protein [Bacteroidota bacterium]